MRCYKRKKYRHLIYFMKLILLNVFFKILLMFSLKNIDEKKVLWNSREIWNNEVSALIDAAIS